MRKIVIDPPPIAAQLILNSIADVSDLASTRPLLGDRLDFLEDVVLAASQYLFNELTNDAFADLAAAMADLSATYTKESKA